MDNLMINNHQPANIHKFIAATLDADRLKLISYLSQDSWSIQDLAEKMDQNQAAISRHLQVLEDANLVISTDCGGNKLYSFNPKYIELIARQQLEQPRDELDLSLFDLPGYQKKTIAKYTRANGSLKLIPSQSKKLIPLLEYIICSFEFEKNYTEKDVNAVLLRFYPDITTLRRYLIDHDYLGRERDGSRYWRLDNRKSLSRKP